MKRRIKKVAILGSGTMGSGIAAQLANAGIRSYLLDIVPREFTEADKKKKLTPESKAFRNKIAEENKQKAVNGRPPQVMSKEDADLITVGNMEDNLAWLSECDWIVEVVPENLDIKKAVFQNILPYIKPGTIVSTNTSGISVNRIIEDMPLEIRQNWLGTHFFNPVRYMKLLEIIPGKETLPEIVEFMADFGERVLGKGIVYCKDTPNFIANRLGVQGGVSFTRKTDELNLEIDEVDAIAGPAMGRPGTAVFGLADLVGLDISVASEKTCYTNVGETEKPLFQRPAWYHEMYNRGLLGNKTGGGFYKKVGKDKLVIDVKTFEYRPIKPVSFPSVDAALKEKSFVKKMQIFFEADDIAAQFVWRHQRDTFLYAATKIGEISDDILNMDRAMRWGYNFAAGPFEMWNGLDLPKYIARMEAEGCEVSAWVKEMLAAGITSFYKTEAGIEYYYCPKAKQYMPITHKPEVIVLPELKAQNKIVQATEGGTLYDIGDGVICLQLNGTVVKANTLDAIKQAQAELAKNWEGMIITGAGKAFSTGNDLAWLMEQINAKNWDAIDQALKNAQEVYLANKYADKPVVAAVFGPTKGSGCEMAMQCAAIQAAGETSMGLVDFGVGLIPANGGIKEMTMRALDRVKGTTAWVLDFLAPYLTNCFTAKSSGSGKDAINVGYLRATDGITMNNDFLLYDAKKRILQMVEAGYNAPLSRSFGAPGLNQISPLKARTKNASWAGNLTDYEWLICCKIIDIMAGGQVVTGGTINEQYLLDLEREAFLSLCGEAKTQDRIVNMLTKGKPLRN